MSAAETSQVHLVGTPSRSHLVLRDGTNERTNERRSHVANNTSLTDTCARVQDFNDVESLSMEPYIEIHEKREVRNEEAAPIIGDIVADLTQWFGTFTPEPERWPIERSGEREPIPWPTRLAVAKRDSFICRHCHIPSYPKIEIDHIVPWSAGGSDRSTNLRVLCVPCNRNRSNRRDGTESWRPLPVTWWCSRCWNPDRPERHPWRTGEDLNIAHRVTHELVTAYCGFCDAPRQTDVTL